MIVKILLIVYNYTKEFGKWNLFILDFPSAILIESVNSSTMENHEM